MNKDKIEKPSIVKSDTIKETPVGISINDNAVVDEYKQVLKSLSTNSEQFLNNNIVNKYKIVLPTYNRDELSKLLVLDETHASCIKFKSTVTSGLGYKFLTDNKSRAMKKVIEWAKNPSGKFGYTLDSFLSDIGRDLEIYHEAFIEIIRYGDNLKIYRGDPRKFYIVPEFNSMGKPIINTASKYIYMPVLNDSNPSVYSVYNGKSSDGYYRSVLHVRKSNQINDFYGTPDYIPVIKYCIENNYISAFNTNYFKNGGKLSFFLGITGAIYTDTQLNEVRSLFTSKVGVDNSHSGVVLAMPSKESRFVFQELSKGFDGSFMQLRISNRDLIMLGHTLSPKILGVSTAGGIGGGSEDIGIMKKTQETVISPSQRQIENLMNLFIEEEFGVNPQLKLNEIDIVNEKDDAIIFNLLHNIVDEFGNRVMTIDEIRNKLGLTEKELNDKIINENFIEISERIKMGLLGNKQEPKLATDMNISDDGKPKFGNDTLNEDEDNIENKDI